MFDIGAKYVVKPTAMNRKNGLQAGKGAWIRFVDGAAITLYFEQAGQADLKVPRPLFGANFEARATAPINAGYAASAHAAQTYG